jgi:hypothetical protein
MDYDGLVAKVIELCHGLPVWTSPARPGCERIGTAFDRCRPAAQFHGEDYVSHRSLPVFLQNVVMLLALAVG